MGRSLLARHNCTSTAENANARLILRPRKCSSITRATYLNACSHFLKKTPRKASSDGHMGVQLALARKEFQNCARAHLNLATYRCAVDLLHPSISLRAHLQRNVKSNALRACNAACGDVAEWKRCQRTSRGPLMNNDSQHAVDQHADKMAASGQRVGKHCSREKSNSPAVGGEFRPP